MSVDAILQGQQKSYTKQEEDTLLAQRAPINHASSTLTYGKGSGDNYGHVKLSNTPAQFGVADGVAATPKCVQDAASKLVPTIGMGKNLLDNWYFIGNGQFPINERGNSSYGGSSSGTPSINRWAIWNSGQIAVSTDNTGIVLSGTTSAVGILRQILDATATQELLGKTVTFSILCSVSDDEGYFALQAGSSVAQSSAPAYGSQSLVSGINTITVTLPSTLSQGYRFITTIGSRGTVNVYAAKLEIGDRQTLAFEQDSTWVLTEVPNYSEELLKCRASIADASDAYANMPVAPAAYASNPVMNGTAASGSSTAWARGDHIHPTDTSRQAKITAVGILKGNGSTVSAATVGTDYGTYSKPAGGIPTSDLASVDSTPDASHTSNLITSAAVAGALTDLLYLQNISTGSASGGIICAASNSKITANHVVVFCAFERPDFIRSDVAWATESGTVTLTGYASAGTKATLILAKKVN